MLSPDCQVPGKEKYILAVAALDFGVPDPYNKKHAFDQYRSENMKIGYQGIEGSNSQAAAANIAARLEWTDVEYVPLIHSKGVVDALKSGEVDYGVMASLNHRAGEVLETVEALKLLSYVTLAGDCIPIHHFLFVKDASVTKPTVIASHPQALKQCRDHLAACYPDAQLMELEDTAIGARYLAGGQLPQATGVLCRQNAGEAFGLHLLEANLEDDATNATEFILIRLCK